MGGDGIVDQQFVALGGRAGDLATNVGAPAESLPSAKQFIADYEAANYAEPFGAYGAFTYDATNVIIEALAKAVQGGTWSEDTRKTVVSNVQATNLAGCGRPGLLRRVRRHHEQGAHRLHGQGRQLRARSRARRAASRADLTVRENHRKHSGGGGHRPPPPGL